MPRPYRSHIPRSLPRAAVCRGKVGVYHVGVVGRVGVGWWVNNSTRGGAMSSQRSASDAERIEECRRRAVRHVQCRYCGFEPPVGPRPVCCPKCHGGCWETFVQVGKLRPAEEEVEAGAEVPITARVGEAAAR